MRRREYDFYGKKIVFETGKVAKQANGSALVQIEGTVVLAAATCSEHVQENQDFFPLTVNYHEKTYAAGKIPGGFFKREGRPSTKEILTSRLTDRSIRPLFPEDFKNEVQVTLVALSADMKNDPDLIAINAANLALMLSDIPFDGPVASVKVGKVNGELLINPDYDMLKESELDMTIAATESDVVMIEAGAREISNEDMVNAIEYAHNAIKQLIGYMKDFVSGITKEKIDYPRIAIDPNFEETVRGEIYESLKSALMIFDKKERSAAVEQVYNGILERYQDDEDKARQLYAIFSKLEKEIVRDTILQGIRVDGRKVDEIRPISCEVGILPRTHGSALFTRGQTQSLGVVTLGTFADAQIIDGLEEDIRKHFMLHYNFPAFSVGEVRPDRGPSRREIGHGALAERALEPLLPKKEDFPYTIRIVSEILESNGSSSMATVCSGSLALMDAGVPIKKSVAGIAMGLVKDGERYTILTDIQGLEDHLGDMDFKVAGTRDGITALQMDIKVNGISMEIMRDALERAYKARIHVLDAMEQVISKPRPNLSPYAPKILQIKIDPSKIRDIIGPGGKVIHKMIEDFNVQIDIDEDGLITIYGDTEEGLAGTRRRIESIAMEIEPGHVYEGVVTKVMGYGAFVEIAPGRIGLCHISKISDKRIEDIHEYVKEGDVVKVKVLELDELGRPVLSMRDVD